MDSYTKIIFLSKKAEQDWNNQPENIKNLTNHLINQNIYDTQRKISEELEKINSEKIAEEMKKQQEKQELETYKWMYLEQKDISAGYRKIIEDQEKEIKRLKNKLEN